jgi:type IV pilus assembly protein PilV
MPSLNLTSNPAKGFTLIEVLISLLVVAVGLLGIAGVQALSLNNTTIALNRSLAALQADGLAAMMHANQHYWQQTGSVPTIKINIPSGQLDCRLNACSSSQMANWDLQVWGSGASAVTGYPALTGLNTTLPAGSGYVQCMAGPPVVCTITVTWNENNLGISGSGSGALDSGIYQQTYSLVVQP